MSKTDLFILLFGVESCKAADVPRDCCAGDPIQGVDVSVVLCNEVFICIAVVGMFMPVGTEDAFAKAGGK
jgi:hypothetical protein